MRCLSCIIDEYKRNVAPKESFTTRFQLAAIIDSSIPRFTGSGGWAGWLAGLAGPKKNFPRLHLTAIIDSLIHRFTGSGRWAGWRAGWAGWDEFRNSEVTDVFHRIAGVFHRSLNGMLPSKKPLLDSSWLLSSTHWFIDSSDLAVGLAGWLGRLAWISRSEGTDVFRRIADVFHRSKSGMLALKKALLDSSWLLSSIHRFIDSSIHRIWRLGCGAGRLVGWLAGSQRLAAG